MSQENVDKARELIAAYNRRDFDAAIKDFDPEIEWVMPARSFGLGLHEALRRSDGCRADVLSLTSLNAAVRGESERGGE
jgi:hypothetical protein